MFREVVYSHIVNALEDFFVAEELMGKKVELGWAGFTEIDNCRSGDWAWDLRGAWPGRNPRMAVKGAGVGGIW